MGAYLSDFSDSNDPVAFGYVVHVPPALYSAPDKTSSRDIPQTITPSCALLHQQRIERIERYSPYLHEDLTGVDLIWGGRVR